MAETLSGLVNSLFASVASSAGSAVAKTVVGNPQVQDSLSLVKSEIDSAKKTAQVAVGVATVVTIFYFLPRFENPIPRIFRKGSRR